MAELSQGSNCSEYAFTAWSGRFGSPVVKEIASWVSPNEDYSTERCHVFRLKNKMYAVVSENGCSCYDYSDAEIEIFSEKKKAMEAYKKVAGA